MPDDQLQAQEPGSFDVTAQFVSYDDTGFAKTGGQPHEETLGSFGVSARLHKDIQHVPVRIHRSPQPLLHVVDRNEDFVQMPLPAAVGRSSLMQSAKFRPNRFTQLRRVSRLTVTPRSASRSSTSAVLSAKRC